VVNLVCEAIIPDGPMKEVEEIENSIKTVYRKSIWNKFIKAINDYSLVEDGDKIAIGISGGKDSLLLAKLFSELKKDKSRNFEFKAVSLNPGFRQSDLDNFKNNLNIELEKRNLWVEEQLIIEEVRNFFDTLYIKYLELNKETETLELLIGNGIVRIKERNIYYPVLLKKIKIDFNAKDNILILSDSHSNESFSPFLYTNFLNEINDIQ